MAGIDPTIVKRLTFIRLIYQQGLEQSQRPEPLSMTSILTFHDAVELFLVLAGEQLNAQLPTQTTFMDYWARLAPRSESNKNGLANGVNLTGKVAMDRLNRVRNVFKHAGALPGKEAIEQARVDTTNFFTDNTPIIFGPDVDFLGLGMADVVTQTFVRDKLRTASHHAEQDDYHEAIGLVTDAFDELLNDYTSRKTRESKTSVYAFGEPLWFDSPTRHRWAKAVDRDFVLNYTKLVRSVNWMRRSMRILALGLDYRHYARFELITPYWDRCRIQPVRVYEPGVPITRESYEFCREFVVTASLRLAEVDFDLDHDELFQAWKREHPEFDTAQ